MWSENRPPITRNFASSLPVATVGAARGERLGALVDEILARAPPAHELQA
jgi:hypothetical protein